VFEWRGALLSSKILVLSSLFPDLSYLCRPFIPTGMVARLRKPKPGLFSQRNPAPYFKQSRQRREKNDKRERI
jgi:hypothetical protein